jgi:hypothetical protein
MDLRQQLNYKPVPLKFGTSGRRGLIADLTQLEVYLNALAELEYLQSLPRAEGGVAHGEEFFFACDLRPSSSAFVPGHPVRGELAQAIALKPGPQLFDRLRRSLGDIYGFVPRFGWLGQMLGFKTNKAHYLFKDYANRPPIDFLSWSNVCPNANAWN